jgi:hypothetical protein
LRRVLARPGGVYLARTLIDHLDGVWFAGNLPDHTAPSTVYAISGATARVLWRRPVPGLEAILLHSRQLVAAADGPHGSGGLQWAKLVSLAVGTGKPIWEAKLPLGMDLTQKPKGNPSRRP